MNRTLKFLVYGVLYLAIISMIAFGVYRIWFYKAPSCFDNIQNGSETGVDCGGPCIPCAVKNLKLDASATPRIFPATANQSILFAEVTNPSSDYAVSSFAYSIEVWSVLGVPITTVSGASYIPPGGTRYLVFPNLPSAAANVEQPLTPLTAGNVIWTPATNFTEYDLQINGVTANLTASGGEVDGTVVNNSPSNVPLTHFSALIFDSKGNIVSASAADINNIAPFSTTQLRVYFPPLGRYINSVDRTKTKVFYEVVKG